MITKNMCCNKKAYLQDDSSIYNRALGFFDQLQLRNFTLKPPRGCCDNVAGEVGTIGVGLIPQKHVS